MMRHGKDKRDERDMRGAFFGHRRGGAERPMIDECEGAMGFEACAVHMMRAHGGHMGGGGCPMPGFHGHPGHGDHGFGGPHGAILQRFGGRMGALSRTMRGVFDLAAFSGETFDVVTKEEGEGYLVSVFLPGIEKGSISLECLPGMLIVAVEQDVEGDGKVTELPLLLAQCDETAIRARYHDGVLEISVPKVKGRKIEVQ